MSKHTLSLQEAATQVLHQAASAQGIKATPQQTDNYNRIWARDSAVASLAIIAQQIDSLYPAVAASLLHLQQAAHSNGQIPSNISIDEQGELSSVSFGGPVGRTDASFWWLIATLLFVKQQPNTDLQLNLEQQAKKIFETANNWEFNHKHLMYVPMSSNWADEYVTHGYVLYDQILRYWALQLAGDYFDNNSYAAKALQVKTAIKQHFLLEAELQGSLYTLQQQQLLQHVDMAQTFIASFSPGDIVQRYDGWSIALLLLLQIPNASTTHKLAQVLQQAMQQYKAGIPAFFPVIETDDTLYKQLQSNHHYRFKNSPGHFHNGGIWGVVNGFLVAGLMTANEITTAKTVYTAVQQHLEEAMATHPFPEYVTSDGQPHGVNNLCYTAAGYLIANQSIEEYNQLAKLWQIGDLQKKQALQKQVEQTAKEIIQQVHLNKEGVIAIAVAGESGSGKTTLGKALYKVLQQMGYQALLLHQDDYFKLPPKQNHAARLANFNHIGVEEVRLSLLDEHIKQVKSKQHTHITTPIMDWITDTEQQQTINIQQTQVVLVEGTYTSLLKQVDYIVFINSTYKDTKQNRIHRNREAITDFIEQVLEKESAIIQPHAALADMVVDKNWKLEKLLASN